MNHRTWQRVRRIISHVWGPTGSMLLHVLVVLLLFKLVVGEPPREVEEFAVTYLPVTPPPPDDPEPPDDTPWDDLPATPVDMPAQPDEPSAEPPPDFKAEDWMSRPQDPGTLAILDDVPSLLIIPKMYAGRSGDGRLNGIASYAGGGSSEPSVVKALEWLKKNQAPDGSWGPNKPAMTGLGLLTFLAHGETLSSDAYGETVGKAMRFLMTQQNEAGQFHSSDGQAAPYVHAIATYAVSEAYGMTRIPDMRPAMEKAVGVIVAGQQPGGGWDYRYAKAGRRDTSVAGWQIQALKAARIAGAETPGLAEALDRATSDLLAARDPETGRFYYTDRTSHKTDSITAIASLCLQLLGRGKSGAVDSAFRAMGAAACDWEEPGEWPMYAWYYLTQTHFHEGGMAWARWNGQFSKTLVRHQNEDGSWTSPAGARGGAGSEAHLGPVYSTTLAALSLQVYYRVLPTYKQVAAEPVTQAAKNDIGVEIL
ncbi:MAG: terpene cyclase/mutase family protein [Kiritimatiellae bacterium]|nr:terpene cyclase/mutase family protein [Kiritimatiellia bacterium]